MISALETCCFAKPAEPYALNPLQKLLLEARAESADTTGIYGQHMAVQGGC